MNALKEILHDIITGPPLNLALLIILLALVIFGIPKVWPVIKTAMYRRKLSSINKEDMSATLLNTIRAEARHSAVNAVGPVMIRMSLYEKQLIEMRRLQDDRHSEMKKEIDKVVDMVEELRPMQTEVVKLATSVEYMRAEQSEFREDVREGLRDIRGAIAKANDREIRHS